MGKPSGFMDYQRQAMPGREPLLRLNDWHEVYERLPEDELKRQGARCMDCGIPFCQSNAGCPIDNLIPEWNDLVYRDKWREAYERLAKTNNFAEFTGRICPAPCEDACVLGITDPAVTIKSIECQIIDRAFENGWVQPTIPETRTGKKVAIIGSGPAGLAAADQLNKVGHHVTVFERDDRIGGLLMYGVPNMKLDKHLVDRRVDILRRSGIEFRTNADVGVNVDPDQLKAEHDAVVLACGALQHRDLNIPGRHLKGVQYAMPYLTAATRHLYGRTDDPDYVDVRDKHVIVIGGGDTGADCIGTALRQGAKSILNITRREREPDHRDTWHPWPGPPGTYFLDYSHIEGKARFGRDPREYCVLPLEFIDDGRGHVKAIKIERLKWIQDPITGEWSRENTGKIEQFPADHVFLSIGFTGHDANPLTEALGVTTEHGTIPSEYGRFNTNVPGVFVAGDMRRGASLIVWAIAEGRGVAHAVDQYLMGASDLPVPNLETSLPSTAG